MPREHILKSWPNHWEAVRDGRKMFEYRKDDRGYEVGDVLVLRQWDPTPTGLGMPMGFVWGRSNESSMLRPYIDLRVVVTYIARGMFGIPQGYCVMGVRPEPLPVEEYAPTQEEMRAVQLSLANDMLREQSYALALAQAQVAECEKLAISWSNAKAALSPSEQISHPKVLGICVASLDAALKESWRTLPPIDLVLHCPECGKQHMDIGEFETRVHRKHLCENTPEGAKTGCGHLWVPFQYPTRGVEKV